MNNCDSRRVCFKDLEAYLKKDDYFKGLTPDEQAIIRNNLGIRTDLFIQSATYSDINSWAKQGDLTPGNLYVIEDFLTIYECNDQILGLDTYPSETYHLLLTAITETSFDNRIKIIEHPEWEVLYDITLLTLKGEFTNKGTITYLKDSNNNSAYYDFKNIRWYRNQLELNKGKTTYNKPLYFYTFTLNGLEASEGVDCKNNHLEKGCYDIVFLGPALNNAFEADTHNVTFFTTCENNRFYYGTHDVYFTDIVRMMKGAVHNATLHEITATSNAKEFNVLDGEQVIVYLDSLTLTFQLYKI